MKPCFKCGESKPLTDFYRHPRMADGHLNKCKACTKRDANEHRAANLDAVREYDRQRGKLPARKAHAAATVKAWAAQHPDRKRAQTAVSNAVRDGRLRPWPVCALPTCDKPNPVAHHADYSQPLAVVWICQAHHKQAHALLTRLI